MICATHSWWFDGPCPRCDNGNADIVGEDVLGSPVATTPAHIAPDPERNVRETQVEEPYVEPPLPAETGDVWEIPAFLQRLPGGGWRYPSLHPGKPNAF